MPVLTFSLPGLPPSQNKRLHYMVRAKANQQWKDAAIILARDAANRNRLAGLPWSKVHVRYNFHYPRVTLADPDNLIGSMKPCLDGMKGIIFPDDNVTVIHDLSVRVDVVKKMPPGVVVVVEPCACSEPATTTSVQSESTGADLT